MELRRGTDQWSDWYEVVSPNSRVVEFLRRSVLPDYRKYEPNGSKWYVHNKYYDAVKQIMEPYTTKIVDDPWAVLHLRPNAPQAIVKAAYREMVKMHHPDHGGSADTFRKIQAAYDKLTEDK